MAKSAPPASPPPAPEPDTQQEKPATPHQPASPTPPVKPAKAEPPPPAVAKAESERATATPSEKAKGTEAKKGEYSVQIVAFSAGERLAAEQYKARLEANTDLEADLVTSEDGKYVRVLVGRYPDKASAAKARDELRKRKGFADCFVRRR